MVCRRARESLRRDTLQANRFRFEQIRDRSQAFLLWIHRGQNPRQGQPAANFSSPCCMVDVGGRQTSPTRESDVDPDAWL
jgi:hypothetical protein